MYRLAKGSGTCTWLSSHSSMAAEGRERLLTKLLSACRSQVYSLPAKHVADAFMQHKHTIISLLLLFVLNIFGSICE